MKKSLLIIGLILCINTATCIASDDNFSFIGINWSDNPNTVLEKINKSGYAQYIRQEGGQYLLPARDLRYGFVSQMFDDEKWKELMKKGGGLEKERADMFKIIKFKGKSDSMIADEAIFLFSDQDNFLTSYSMHLSPKKIDVDKKTGQGQFFQSLVEKYGQPTGSTRYSKKWSKPDQSLYYTFLTGVDWVVLTYINEKNLASCLDKIEKIEKKTNEASGKAESNAAKKDF